MAKKQEQYLEVEAKRIGYTNMLEEIEELISTDVSETQRIALVDQKTKIKEMLEAL